MIVLTVDQRGSRTDRDRVPDVLSAYADTDAVRPFERTAGDEIQAVFTDAAAAARIALDLAASGHWTVGVGTGPVDQPLPADTRAGRGRAFEAAREAVEAAKHHRLHLRMAGTQPWTDRAQTAAWLLLDTMAARSDAGRAAVELMRTGITQNEAAARLRITPQAVSARLRAAGWDLQTPGEALVADLLDAAEAHQ